MIVADIQYFPPVSFYSASYADTHVIFPVYDEYQKMSFANRCVIAGANNNIILSIPILGGRQQKVPYSEIRISRTTDWQKQHWRSIKSAYNRSPYFEHYAGELEKLFKQPAAFLLDWNRSCLEWIKAKTGWRPVMIFEVNPGWRQTAGKDESDNIIKDWRRRLLPKTQLSFPAPVYHQVFEASRGFQANLSVLDLLFNTGPEAHLFMAKGAELA